MKTVKKAKQSVNPKTKTRSKIVKMPSKGVKIKVSPKKEIFSNHPSKLTTPKTPFKQSEFFAVLAEQTSLSKKAAKEVIEAIKAMIKVHLVKAGPGQLIVPGLCKLVAVTKPATKAKKGRNPFTGEEMMFKAKPARRVIKIKPLKKFKSELE